jgi:hypothetical protein
MELLVKPEMFMSYIYGRMFGNAKSLLFLSAAQGFKLNQCRKLSCVKYVYTLPATKITLITNGI